MKVVIWLKLETDDDDKAHYELQCRNIEEPGVGIPSDLLQRLVPRILDDLARQTPVAPTRKDLGSDDAFPGEPEWLD